MPTKQILKLKDVQGHLHYRNLCFIQTRLFREAAKVDLETLEMVGKGVQLGINLGTSCVHYSPPKGIRQ